MRLAEDTIKQAILHPEEQIRLDALGYFVEAHSEDDSLMPLVIEAVERYGREGAFQLLRRADRLSQTPNTIDWLIGELQRDFDLSEVVWDNHCFAVALILLDADPALLIGRQSEIVAAPCFPQELAPLLEVHLKLHCMNWQALLSNLVDFCEQYPDTESMPLVAIRRGNQIVEALARRLRAHPQEQAEFDEHHSVPQGSDESTLAAFEVRLAGSIRAEKRVPWLIAMLHDGPMLACDECNGALIRIGTDEVVRRLVDEYPDAGDQFRDYVPGVLAHIHSDLAADACMNLFQQAYDTETAISVAYAWLDQLDDRAILPIHEFVAELMDEYVDVEVADLFHALVSASMIMGAEFPDFAEWRQTSEAANWGFGDRQPKRISEGFFDETKTLESAILEIAKEGGWRSSSDAHDENDDFEDDSFEEPPPTITFVRESPKVGRNDPCPCGSGKKYKKCCLHRTNGGGRPVR